MEQDNSKVILFDGVCNLCNNSVTFVIKRDSKNVFKFAALQSETGRELIEKFHIDTDKIDSIILIDGDRTYVKSTAALRIAKELKGGWPLLYGFILLPSVMRNWLYDWVARNRYRWFGKKESCMIPTPELQEKFL